MIYAHIPVSPLSLFGRRVSKFRTEILIFIVICMYMVTEILQNFPLQHRPHNRLLASIQSERTNFFPDMTIATPFRLALSETVQWFGSDLITGYLKWGTRRAGNIHTMFRKSVDVIAISVLGFHGATAITSMRISFDRSWKFGLRIDHILSPWSRLTTPGLHIYCICHRAKTIKDRQTPRQEDWPFHRGITWDIVTWVYRWIRDSHCIFDIMMGSLLSMTKTREGKKLQKEKKLIQ